SRLWNEVEASETRRNSVTAREWELALPSPRP
ncbi:MAG: MobA/MobL family protein, partial [Pseudomonadota bacterium]